MPLKTTQTVISFQQQEFSLSHSQWLSFSLLVPTSQHPPPPTAPSDQGQGAPGRAKCSSLTTNNDFLPSICRGLPCGHARFFFSHRVFFFLFGMGTPQRNTKLFFSFPIRTTPSISVPPSIRPHRASLTNGRFPKTAQKSNHENTPTTCVHVFPWNPKCKFFLPPTHTTARAFLSVFPTPPHTQKKTPMSEQLLSQGSTHEVPCPSHPRFKNIHTAPTLLETIFRTCYFFFVGLSTPLQKRPTGAHSEEQAPCSLSLIIHVLWDLLSSCAVWLAPSGIDFWESEAGFSSQMALSNVRESQCRG